MNRSTFGIDEKFKLMLFDLSIYGHHPAYIQHLIKYWNKQELPGNLDIVVLPKFMQEHADVVKLALDCTQKNIHFVPITLEEEAALKSRNSSFNRGFRAFQEWHLLNKYATSLKATRCLLMYFDTCEFPLLSGAKLSCPFSGIYFRPTFHYHQFTNYKSSFKDYLQQRREQLFLSRILNHPQLETLFCLDPFVEKHIDKFHSRVRAVHLPDPVQIYEQQEFQSEKLQNSLGIDPSRKVFLLFGSLTKRKGIYQVLEAISLLPPVLCQQLCLMVIGEGDPTEITQLKSQIADVCQSRPVQIITHCEFVPEQDIPTYFQIADVVLATYQRHVGMSGILLLAAAAQKPVLSSNYGLMGEIVQQYHLGLTVDSTVPGEIAHGLTRFLLESPQKLCTPTQMKHFAEQNSADKFAEVIFQNV